MTADRRQQHCLAPTLKTKKIEQAVDEDSWSHELMLLEIAIKSSEACKLEDGVIWLLFDLAAPIPCRGQAAIYT